MVWLFAIVGIFILAFIIIKLSIDTSKNPDSKLSVFEHPSTFKKPDLEMVEKSKMKREYNHNSDKEKN